MLRFRGLRRHKLRDMSMLAERECWARRPDQGAGEKVRVTRRTGPGSRACGTLALREGEVPRAGALGNRARLALPAAEIPPELALGLCKRHVQSWARGGFG